MNLKYISKTKQTRREMTDSRYLAKFLYICFALPENRRIGFLCVRRNGDAKGIQNYSRFTQDKRWDEFTPVLKVLIRCEGKSPGRREGRERGGK